MCLECISVTSIKSQVPFRSCSKLNSYPLTGAVSTGQSIISEKQSTPNYTLNTDRECNKKKQHNDCWYIEEVQIQWHWLITFLQGNHYIEEVTDVAHLIPVLLFLLWS